MMEVGGNLHVKHLRVACSEATLGSGPYPVDAPQEQCAVEPGVRWAMRAACRKGAVRLEMGVVGKHVGWTPTPQRAVACVAQGWA